MRYILRIFFLIALTVKINVAISQCVSLPAMPTCTGTQLVSDNANINSGETYYSSTTQTRGGINTSAGSIFIVCSGNLTVSGNFNGGTIYVLPGATLTTAMTTLNVDLVNWGTVTFNSGLTVNSSGRIENAAGATLNIIGNLFENSVLTNYGTANVTGTLTVQNGGSGVCLGGNGKLYASTIEYGNNTNAIQTPIGKSCLDISSTTISGSVPLSSNAGLNICAPASISINGTGTWGSATVNQNCASCGSVLPIELVEFTGKNQKEFIFLEWTTASEKNNDFFSILKSYDGISFENISDIDGAGNSTTMRYYAYKDYDARTGMNYYKLKQTDYDGKNVDSKIISINRNDLDFNILVYPIPSASPNVKVTVNKHVGIATLKFINITGQTLLSTNINTNESLEYELGKTDIPSGTYFIKIESENVVFIKEIIIKNN
ncbi:MAG: T9SS type A sorting domain-containing protein [Candidatus Pacearchaeota archaeon]|jgi:hypothetical protein|nr:T9SS type A sorting domain-containing protein [Clostridia bacterium]